MTDYYNSIKEQSIGEFKDRGSKFIAYLFSVRSEQEFQMKLASIKSQHPKARHFCPAIRLVDGLERSSDDGEPSGSAGKPILNQLLSAELKDIGCVVVRYFGGTKLGVSGLINAYKLATKTAIDLSIIEERYLTQKLRVHFEYAVMGKLMSCMKKLSIDIATKHLEAEPYLELDLRLSEYAQIVQRIKARWLNRAIEDLTEDDEFEGLRFEELED